MKCKDLIGVPWMLAFALWADGWYLRSDIVFNKINAMPDSVRDRPVKSHEYVFLFAKQARYYYDHAAVREPFTMRPQRRPSGHKRRRPGPDMKEHVWEGTVRDEPRCDGNPAGRNRRSVWTISTQPFKGAHFAVMPEALAESCILAGSACGDVVLDPFCGSGTTGVVAARHGRIFLGIDAKAEYCEMARERIAGRAA